jgi:thiol-disulfide isomerase/thioredoxin
MNGTIVSRIAPWLAAALLCTGCRPREAAPWTSAASPAAEAPAAASDLPLLTVGTMAPPLQTEGWLNGAPPAPGSAGVKLIVLDVWADWCPVCRTAAPGLVRIYQKYRSRGVIFVSVTDLPEPIVAGFVDEFRIPWPSGYGAARPTINALGVLRPDRTGPGYDIAPALYLIDGEGRVRWNDANARYRHKDTRLIIQELDGAIEAALAN